MGDGQREQVLDGTALDAPARFADDEFYRALAAAPRRRLLAYLLAETESTVDELTAALTGWDAVDGGGMSTPDDRERVRIAVVHTHVPLLVDARLVSYDADTETVRITDFPDAAAELIRLGVAAEREQ